MRGYDTVRVAFPGIEFDPGRLWQARDTREHGRIVTAGAFSKIGDVRVSHWAFRDEADGRHATELRVETSLPKLLAGENSQALWQRSDLERAIDTASDVVSGFLGRETDLRPAHIRRADVVRDLHLGTEEHVRAALHYLGQARYARPPIRHQAGNLSWIGHRGGYTRRIYGKYRESVDRGAPIESARGQLRVEVQCNGQRSLRRAWPASDNDRTIVLADLLCEQAREFEERVMAKLEKAVETAVGAAPMAFEDVMRKLVTAFPRKSTGVRLIGFAYLIHVGGWEAVESVVARQNVHEIRRQFEKAGVDPLTIQWPTEVAAEAAEELRSETQRLVSGELSIDAAIAEMDQLEAEIDESPDPDPDEPVLAEDAPEHARA